MSIYFFSEKKENDEHKIMALAGIKCLVLPKNIANDIQSKIQKKIKESNLSNNYAEILDSIISSEFSEEYDHFKCLIQSKVTSNFHLRNVLLRVAYSKYMNKKITNIKIHDRFIRKVINYFLDYHTFHDIAYGYIEAHYQLKSNENTVEERFFYREKINDAINDLTCNYKIKCFDENHKLIGWIIDKKYTFVFSKNSNKYFLKILGISIFRNIYLSIIILNEQIFEYYVIERVLNTFIKNYKVVLPYVVSRFVPTTFFTSKSMFTGHLPAIVSENIVIDPVAFLVGKQSLNGQEAPFDSPEKARKSILLWHIISRTVACYCLNKNMGRPDIKKYFKMLYTFNTEWSPNAKDGFKKMESLDNEIIRECYILYSDKDKTGICPINEMEKIIFEVYSKWKEEPEFSSQVDISNLSLLQAMDCTYFHV